MDSVWHDIVSGSFRSRLDENRRLNFGETLLIEIVACALYDLVSESQVSLHLLLSEIEISVFEPELIVYVIIILYVDRRSLGCRINSQIVGKYFNVSCRDVGVFGTSFLYYTLYTDAVFTA